MQADLGHELREAGIGAERVGHGLNGEVDEAVGTLLVGAVKPVERRVVFTEASVNSRDVDWGNVARLCQVLELRENLASPCSRSGDSQRMPIQADRYGLAAREFARLGKLVQSLLVHFLFPESGSEPKVA